MGDSSVVDENVRGLTLPRGFKCPEEEEYDVADELPTWRRPIIRRRNSTPWNGVFKQGIRGRYGSYTPSFQEKLGEESSSNGGVETDEQGNNINTTPTRKAASASSAKKLNREASQSLGDIQRKSSLSSLNSTSSSTGLNSPVDPNRTLYWSASLLYYTGVPSPTIKNKHLMCQVPTPPSAMDRRRLAKSPSVDSGNGSGAGSLRRRHASSQSPAPPAATRKRHNSIGSSSTNSSSSVGSLKDKEKAEKGGGTEGTTTPSPGTLSTKKRNSLTSLIINRKGSLNRKRPEEPGSSSPTTSDLLEDGEDSRSSSRCWSGSGAATPESGISATGSKGFKESLKAAKNFLSHSSGNKTPTDEEMCARLSRTMARDVDAMKDMTLRSRSKSPVKGTTSKGKSDTLPNGRYHKESVSPNKSATLPGGSGGGKDKIGAANSAEKSSSKSPAKKALSKLFSKKTRVSFGDVGHPEMPEDSVVVRRIVTGKGEDNSAPDIVTFESEPRVLVPKVREAKEAKEITATPKRIVTLGKNNRDFKEMEVSEEAVALAKKIKEQHQKEDEEKVRRRERRSGSLTSPTVVNGSVQGLSPALNEDGIQETDIDDTVRSGYEAGTEPEIVKRVADPLRTGLSVNNGRSSRGEQRSGENSELESGIGTETPPSSLDEPALGRKAGEDYRHHNGNGRVINVADENDVDDEDKDEEGNVRGLTKSGASNAPTEIDEDEASLGTTVTSTESDFDTSLNLSKSLALTEDELSYTESFKQLKPFQFEHHDPVPEGKRERLYKVLVVGELGTGKTSIIKRYVHQFFSQHYRATIGVDFALKVLRWDPETVVRLQLWDIAGQERFGSMTRVYYKEAVGAFVVFDVTRGATLEAVPKWKADLDAKVVLPDGRPIPTILLANKSDQPKEGIAANREKMNEFCQQQGFSGWFETSAKDNINIEESANFLVSQILEMDKWSQEPMASDPDKLDLGSNGKHRGGGSSSCSC